MKVHDLKCWPAPFAAVRAWKKNFEYRKNDRDYQVGDILVLREWAPDVDTGYSGEVVFRQVNYLLAGPDFGVPDGFVVMSLTGVPQ